MPPNARTCIEATRNLWKYHWKQNTFESILFGWFLLWTGLCKSQNDTTGGLGWGASDVELAGPQEIWGPRWPWLLLKLTSTNGFGEKTDGGVASKSWLGRPGPTKLQP